MFTKIRQLKWFAAGTLALLAVGGFVLWQTFPVHAAGSLIGYWKFDESVAGDPAVDQSGNGNTLTPVGDPQPSTDRPAQLDTAFADPYSISLDGSGQYFSISTTPSLDSTASGVTIAVWVKFNDVNGSYQSIASKWRIGVQQQWTLQLNANNKIGWWTGNGGNGADNLESASTIVSDTWYHIIVTLQGLNKKIYINGELEGSKTSSVAMGVAAGIGVGIGAKTVGSPEYLNGLVDDLRIYSYALSDSEAELLAEGEDVAPDTTAPAAPGTPTATSPTLDNTPTVSWTASSDSGSGLQDPAYTLEWSTSPIFASVAGSATTNGTSLAPSTGLADGSWYFRVRAADNSGNTAVSGISGAVVIDTTAPTTPGMPSVSTPSNDNTPTWDWTASTDNGTGLAFIAYAVQWSQDTSFFGLGGQAGVTENSYTIPDGLSMTDSTWYFRAKAIDVVGNESDWSDYGTVHIDTVVPVISDLAATPGASAGQWSITWLTDKDTSSKVSYGLTSGLGTDTAETDISPRLQSHAVTLDGLASCSTYYFVVISEDAAGNVATSDPQSFDTGACPAPPDEDTDADTPSAEEDGGIARANDTVPDQAEPEDDTADPPRQTPAGSDNRSEPDGADMPATVQEDAVNNAQASSWWWLLIFPAAAAVWWLIAAIRRRKQ